MFAVAPMPIFSLDRTWDFRPAVPSPLASSSPIRESTPLSPIDGNTRSQRDVQSSPIQAPKFKFAARPAKKNPVVRKREDARDGRRRLFLQNVRQRGEDRAWERRDVETFFSKSDWINEVRERERARLAEEPILSEADIEDGAELLARDADPRIAQEEFDDVMVEMMIEHEESAMDALISSYDEAPSQPTNTPDYLDISDDEYFDQEVIDMMLSQEANQAISGWQEMDIS